MNLEVFTYKGRLELYNGKTRRFEFESNNRSYDRWMVMDKALKVLSLDHEQVMDLEFFSITTINNND